MHGEQNVSGAASFGFGSSVLARLDARIAPKPGVAQAQRIALDLIDEDPKQPRHAFDNAQLEQIVT